MSLGIDRKKLVHNEEVDSEGTWAISYGDMVTLLLAFFVLFFTVDPVGEKEEKLKQNLLVELQKEMVPKEYRSDTQGDKKSDREPANINVGSQFEENFTEDIVKEWGGKVYRIGNRIIIDFPGVSFFKLGYIDLNNEGKNQLERFVKVYLPYAGSYILGIRAYTDSRKVRFKGRYRDNLELSALRSISAMRTLREMGIPLSRMRLGGYGELKLTHDNMEKWAKDKQVDDKQSFARKVVLVIEPEEKEEGSS